MNSVARNPLQADQHARAAALNPDQSFVVQAPAGSGKTELLIQRLLAVLAQADHPSEVLAITFTNKAAGEMRERLYNALRSAQMPADDSLRPVEEARRALAAAVLQRDATRGWKLMDRPDAVLIDTFDAFCARLAARAPLQQVAASAALAPIEPSLAALYREAARSALFDDDVRHQSTILLTLAANRVDDVVGLIADLLARRAQWLGEAVDTSDDAVARLTAVLVLQVETRIAHVAGLHNHRLDSDICALAQFTATVFDVDGRDTQSDERTALAQTWPVRAELADLSHWQTLSDMLLTASGELRKPGGVNVKAGFPIPKDAKYAQLGADERAAMKSRMQALLTALEHESAFVSALAQTRALPAAAAIAEHEAALKATLTVLKVSAAYLSLLMRERGVTDFSGVLLAALSGLRDAREDVLAGLDATLKHILVDEVQDTNPAQFELLCLLTQDWSSGDGRTLFLVGDPMQSIYGFRDADVSLFLQAQAHGVGAVALTPLTLTANYRSQPVIVDWVNQEIARVFSVNDGNALDEESRVKFVAAVAVRAPGSLPERVVQLPFATESDEANSITERVAQIRADEPGASIAVLVRGRAHASALIAQFAARGIAFAAREFAEWSARETVRDLLSLTYAIAQPSDRLSLFSVLRSPWVGCTLATLAAFANALDGSDETQNDGDFDGGMPVRATPALAPAAHLLRADQAWLANLTDGDERARVAHASAAFSVADAHAWMSSLSERVEAAWRALGGPSWLADDAAHEEVNAFFSWLSRVSTGGVLPPRHELELLLKAERQSFSSSASADPKAEAGTVEILTIHKAKGLEWDHVFLLGADRPVRGDARALAQWRFVSAGGEHGPSQRAVLIAARDSRRRVEGSVFDFVSDQTRAAREDEGKRLLYVAATRARRTLTLSRTSAHKPPSMGSFAYMLGMEADASVTVDDAPPSRRLLLDASLKRAALPTAFGLETIVWPAYRATDESADTAVPVENRDARAQGIVGHLLFEGLAATHPRGIAFSPNVAATERRLLQEGASAASARAFSERMIGWFSTASSRANVQLLFDATHVRRNTEWTLPGSSGDTQTMRVDYTFVTVDNVRWVIDFKFAEPGPNADQALWRAAQVAQYRAQLVSYVARIRSLDTTNNGQSIRAALYFPWIDCLEEIAL